MTGVLGPARAPLWSATVTKGAIMNDVVSPALLAEIRNEEITKYPDGSADFNISPELNCLYDRSSAVLWAQIAPRGIPCFSQGLLRDMELGSALIEGHFLGNETKCPLRYIIVRSGIPNVFNVGGDLGYFQRLIVNQDRAKLIEYARSAINVSYRNYIAHNLRGVTTVALLEGDALGGGFECALSCNVVIAERHIKAAFPEVLFDMFPGMGSMSVLSRRVNQQVVNELTRSGRQFGAQELLELGVIDLVVDTGDGVEAVNHLMRQRECQQQAHSAMNTVDRMLNPVTLNELNEVVRLWVDCALQLSSRGLEWMRRLHKHQLTIFGGGLELVPAQKLVAA